MPGGIKIFKRPRSHEQRKQARKDFVAVQRKLERLELETARSRSLEAKRREDDSPLLAAANGQVKRLEKEIALLKDELRLSKTALLEIANGLSVKSKSNLSKDVKKFIGMGG